jgi:hypothetical protein
LPGPVPFLRAGRIAAGCTVGLRSRVRRVCESLVPGCRFASQNQDDCKAQDGCKCRQQRRSELWTEDTCSRHTELSCLRREGEDERYRCGEASDPAPKSRIRRAQSKNLLRSAVTMPRRKETSMKAMFAAECGCQATHRPNSSRRKHTPRR